VSLLVAGVFGGIIVSPGSLYPRSNSYRYKDELSRLGPMLYAGVLGMLLATAVTQYLFEVGVDFGRFHLTMDLFLTSARIFLIFEHLVIVFPFTAFAGEHIMKWSRVAWWSLAIPIVALFAVRFF
jgi:hypothetical protein